MLLSSFAVFLIFATPNAFAQSFDEETCLSFISADKVKEITKFDGTLNVNVINTNLESLNEGVSSGCAIAFQTEDTSFSLSLVMTASDSDRIAQSIYGEVFSASHQMGVEVVEGNNGPWIHHLVEFNSNGIGSFLASIKDNIQVGLSAPQTEIPIEPSAMLEILKIVQSGIDKQSDTNEKQKNVNSHMGSSEQMGHNRMMMGQHHTPHNGMCAPGFASLGEICTLDDRCGPGAYAGRMCMMDGVMNQYLRPHHQKYAGISVDNIICLEGKELMFKHHDASPACVNHNSIEKLKHRGWQTEKPGIACTMEYNPVCGMDGITYGNMCGMNAEHMVMSHHGECSVP